MDYRNPLTGEVTPRLKTPAAGPRPGKGAMKDSELQALMSGLASAAVQYIDLELTPERAKATRYYKGDPFGNEEKGRSQVVLTEVRDGVAAIIPELIRPIFSDAERVVEFRPRRPETVDQAEQITDTVNYIFTEENDGFLKTVAVAKDGLVRKHGIFKWSWEKYSAVEHPKWTGLSREQLEALAGDDEVELTMVTPREDGLFDAEASRTIKDGKVCVYEIPPEEFITVRETRSLNPQDVLFVGHRTRKTTGELLGMGISKKDIEEHGGDDASLKDDELAIEREPLATGGEEVEAGEANDRHLYIEAYAKIDFDGDGIAELRRICLLGPSHYPVDNEPVDDLCFAVWCPDPEPHTLMGGHSWADRLMDIQRLKSSLMRAGLDSLAAAIHPRKVIQSGTVNLADAMNTAIGAPIRVQGDVNNAIREFAHTFVGKEVFPILQYVDDVVERRTGRNKGAQGLDADALQSSTKGAVEAAVSAAQAQQEMLVRIFCESALKPLFKGIYKLLVKHQPRPRVIRLRGQWVEIDPRQWDADMDVQVNVALGSGLLEQKVATLMEIAAKQETILAQLGPNNPLVTYEQYSNTLAEILRLRGKKATERYFNRISKEQVLKMQEEAANAPPPPSPEMMLAQAQIQIEQMKAQAKMATDQAKAEQTAQLESFKAQLEMQLKQKEAELKIELERMKLQIDRERMVLEDDRERDKQAADIQLKIAELEATTGVDLSELEISAQIERERLATQAAGQSAKIESAERVAGAKIESSGPRVKGKKTVKKTTAKPKARRVQVERDDKGRLVGAIVQDVEETE